MSFSRSVGRDAPLSSRAASRGSHVLKVVWPLDKNSRRSPSPEGQHHHQSTGNSAGYSTGRSHWNQENDDGTQSEWVRWVGNRAEEAPDLDAPEHVVDRLALLKFSQDMSRKNALPHQKLPTTNVFLNRSGDGPPSRSTSPEPHKKHDNHHRASLRRPLSSFSSQTVASIKALKAPETPSNVPPTSPQQLPNLNGSNSARRAAPSRTLSARPHTHAERKAVVARAIVRKQKTLQFREELEGAFLEAHTFHPEHNAVSRALVQSARKPQRRGADGSRRVQTEFKEEPSKGWNAAVTRMKKGTMQRVRLREVWGERSGFPFSKAVRFPDHYQNDDLEDMEFE